ncbi:PaaI family thioesterase [Solicola gregarius]|uniref:Medium/long-chain acyl-CoA thioesterase YigI n=1 Tax=Solicola gregarius TaxID=2908642 RepID=A0AA46TKK4_9ACTN|nr:PaaI family thioesterase [Solicola gregarius]UYM06602.1 PaaI family thioesterase [Solicola gregarius]
MSAALTSDNAREVLEAQPFSRLLGTRLDKFGDGRAELSLEIRDDLRQQFGFVHGGVLAYLVDNAVTFAAGTVLGPAVLTSGFTISYLAPGKGRELRAYASVVHATRRQVVCRCDVMAVDESGEQTICATGQGTVVARGGEVPAAG